MLDDWGFRRRLPRGQGVAALFAGPSGHGQDDGRRGARARARAGPLPHRPLRRRVEVHRRDGEEPRGRLRRGRAGQRRPLLRRGRLAVRQAHRGPRRARPLREPRGQLPAAAGGDVHRARHPGEQPTGRARRGIPAAAALRDPLRAARRRRSARRLWRRSFPRRAPSSPSSTGRRSRRPSSPAAASSRRRSRRRTWPRPTAARSPRVTSSTRSCASTRSSGRRGPASDGGPGETQRPLRLRVESSAAPEPSLLRAAIAARLAGRAFPSRAEDEVAVQVAARRARTARVEGRAVALIKGILASFDDPLLGVVPTIVPFQYNPTEITRVFRIEAGSRRRPASAGRAARRSTRHGPRPRTTRSSSSSTRPTGSRRRGR